MSTHLTSSLISSTIKLGLAGATIVCIGWAFLTVNSTGEVQESQADIIDLELLAPHTSTQKFVSALDALGHEKPRIYDYNGTQVFFSTRTTPVKPRDLINEYQETFVAKGVNSQVWPIQHPASMLEDKEKLSDYAYKQRRHMLDGELQVIYHDTDRVIMSGAVIDAEKYDITTDGLTKRSRVLDFQKIFKMHRYVEAEWNPVTQHTTVTATWGDEDFDITKTMPEELQDPKTRNSNNSPDLEVPACIGCTRLTRFAAVANDKPYVKQIFESSERPEMVANFYKQAMPRQGWTKMPGEHLTTYVDSVGGKSREGVKLLQFQRNGRFVTINIHPNDNGFGSTVSTMTTD